MAAKKAQFKLHRFDQELPKECLEKSAEKQSFLVHKYSWTDHWHHCLHAYLSFYCS